MRNARARSTTATGALVALGLAAAGCLDGGSDFRNLGATDGGNGPRVVWDVFAEPLPEIPLPNDFATRTDATSPSGVRVNASMLGPTALEGDLRRLLDGLDGWGTFQPISVRFTSRIDVADLAARHQENVDFSDDAVFVINIDPRSPRFGEAAMLDVGRGNFPLNVQDISRDQYFRQDPRGMASNIMLETVSEDANLNGVLDPGEDTDFDGVLDLPNVLNPFTRRQCTAAEADLPECDPLDHLVDFYEFETETLILRPLVSLDEKTRYAVVLTKRLRGLDGAPVRSPFATINHARQNSALAPLGQVLGRYGLDLDDVAFAWSFTTQSVTDELKLVVDGINGEGPFRWITDEVPPELSDIADFEVPAIGLGNPRIVKFSEIDDLLNIAALLLFIGFGVTDFADIPAQVAALLDGYQSLDYLVVGEYETPYLIDNEDQVFRTDPIAGTIDGLGTNRATWWMTVPKTVPGDCEPPFPMAIYQHGYSTSKLEVLGFAGSLGRFCIASIGIDAVEHGPDENFADLDAALRRLFDGAPVEDGLRALIFEELLPPELLENEFIVGLVNALLDAVFEGLKVLFADLAVKFDPQWETREEVLAEVENLADVVLIASETPIFRKAFADGRAVDATGDGAPDSGARFWTGNLFRTRDQVRQTVVDLAFLIEIFQRMDGARTWKFDINQNGIADDVAGDFDGDGLVDVGGPDADYYVWGQSMGGFFTGILPALDPAIKAAAPTVTGHGMVDIAARTIQVGVVEAVFGEILGPMIVGGTGAQIDVVELKPFFLDPDTKYIAFNTPLGNKEDFVPLIEHARIDAGDRVSLRNPRNGETAEVVAGPDGRFRIAVDADRGDPLFLEVRDGATDAIKESLVVDAPANGFALRRNTPDFRRMMGIAQMVMEPADPGSYSPYLFERPFPGHAPVPTLMIATIGDMAVPVSAEIALARKMGMVDYRTPRPEYGGLTVNDALIKAHVMEGLEHARRYTVRADDGEELAVPLLFNPAYFGDGAEAFDPEEVEPGLGVRVSGPIEPPTFECADRPGEKCPVRPVICAEPFGAPLDACEKRSGFAMPYLLPMGEHGFFTPSPFKPFDIDSYMINLMGRFFITNGRELPHDACIADGSCACLFRTDCGPFAP